MATEQKKLTKSRLMESFKKLPDNATVEDFIDHLAFVLGVEQGMEDLAAGRAIPHDELLKRLSLSY